MFELARSLGVDVVAVNPSSVQGPGRATGSARLLLEVVNGRLPVLVARRSRSSTSRTAPQGHVLAETRGTPGERYLLSGATITTREAVDLLDRIWGLRRRVRFAPGVDRDGRRRARRRRGEAAPPRRDALSARPSEPSSTATGTTAPRPTRELGLRYTPVEATLLRTFEWCRRARPRPACAGPAGSNVGWPRNDRRSRVGRPTSAGGRVDGGTPGPQHRAGARPGDRGRGARRRTLGRPGRQGSRPTRPPSTRCV